MDGLAMAILGVVASGLSTVSLLPQAVKTWHTRSAGDISVGWLVVALISMVLWIVYGIVVGAQAVIWANALTFLQVGYILAVKIKQLRRPRPRGDAEGEFAA